jgi:hypothetical protein
MVVRPVRRRTVQREPAAWAKPPQTNVRSELPTTPRTLPRYATRAERSVEAPRTSPYASSRSGARLSAARYDLSHSLREKPA